MPVITALNAHKNAVNLLGSHQFSVESSQKLVIFYSENIICCKPDAVKQKNKGYKKSLKKHVVKALSSDVQKYLWDALSNSSENISGKLAIFYGMPVMILVL